MLITPPSKFRKNRKAAKQEAVAPSPPPGAALNLVSAEYSTFAGPVLTLTFDRAIDISSLDGTAIVVSDGDALGETLNATGSAVLVSAAVVRFELVNIDTCKDEGDYLNASAASGIVAVDDGGTWAGVSEYELTDSGANAQVRMMNAQ